MWINPEPLTNRACSIRTGEYWPSTRGSTDRAKWLFIIWHSVSDSKLHFRWLAFKNVRRLNPSLKFRKIFNLFSFFWYFQCEEWQHSHFLFAVLVANLNLPLSLQNKIHGLDRFHGNGPYCKILTEKEPIRAPGFAQDWVCHVIISDTAQLNV